VLQFILQDFDTFILEYMRQRSGETCCLHLQGTKWIQQVSQKKIVPTFQNKTSYSPKRMIWSQLHNCNRYACAGYRC